MDIIDQGFPEWTELGQDSGLDPLGMQRPIELIYQSLLPGISTITLRYRYYSFFAWILKYYEDHIEDTKENSDPHQFRVFQRRCEALFALACFYGDYELGIAGIEWAGREIGKVSHQDDKSTKIDFSVGADLKSEPEHKYLRNNGGAFFAIYSTQMSEMGLVHLDKRPIPFCSERALPLAEAFEKNIGSLCEDFFQAAKSAEVSLSLLDKLNVLKPASLNPQSTEHKILKDILLGKVSNPLPADQMRKQTMLAILSLASLLKKTPKSEELKWSWFEPSSKISSQIIDFEENDVIKFWAAYQAFDLMRLAYENLLYAALAILEGAENRRLSLNVLIAEMMSNFTFSENQSWKSFKSAMIENEEFGSTIKRIYEELSDAHATGTVELQIRASFALIIALSSRYDALIETIEKVPRGLEHFRSIDTEMKFLSDKDNKNARNVIAEVIGERVLKRHLWVASRKFRNQRAYTYLMEPDDGFLRYRTDFTVTPSSPRLEQAIRFLKDIDLIDESGITELGRAELEKA
ncbi:hypothetical protein [Pseudaquidulcibacter saccharophilus]|uniref:hypothetical protein n=1 Tax=Pseudaquidulcibacter saccharophilus TaxID=2831900 RepID=UPI001EFF5651|nr:hypothetical protein [Pseudaquidulcibacter saccharophilus]